MHKKDWSVNQWILKSDNLQCLVWNLHIKIYIENLTHNKKIVDYQGLIFLSSTLICFHRFLNAVDLSSTLTAIKPLSRPGRGQETLLYYSLGGTWLSASCCFLNLLRMQEQLEWQDSLLPGVLIVIPAPHPSLLAAETGSHAPIDQWKRLLKAGIRILDLPCKFKCKGKKGGRGAQVTSIMAYLIWFFIYWGWRLFRSLVCYWLECV